MKTEHGSAAGIPNPTVNAQARIADPTNVRLKLFAMHILHTGRLGSWYIRMLLLGPRIS